MSHGNQPPAREPGLASHGERSRGWRFAIDRGGTFTDLVGLGPSGQRLVRKVLSEQPEHPGDPALRALRESLGLAPRQALPAGLVEEVRIGTTVVTNALLERKVLPVLLLLNAGLEDLPWIGDQHRPDIFALRIQRPEPLPMRVVAVSGRLAADGAELESLRLNGDLAGRLEAAVAELEAQGGCAGVAVALLHSCRNPIHELALGAWLRQRLGLPVLLSHAVSPQPRLLPRLQTTVAEVGLRPVLHRYLHQLRQELGPHPRLRVMASSGALLAPELLQARDTILSGPAGGMVGALAVAAAAGLGQRPILGFDMGGTSTDVFYATAAAGDLTPEKLSETGIDGLRLQVAMLPIHTVAAGGGSVLHVDGQRLQVGPASAGANPGPACYRRGGPATITDANLLLGRLPDGALPAVFGPAGDQPVDRAVVRQRFGALALALGLDPVAPLGLERLAQGALAIAIERMAEAIRRVSIQRGHDIREAVLVCYGGAGGQHACALADSLGLSRVLVHPLAGVLSAHGIGLARQRLRREEHWGQPLSEATLAQLRRRRAVLIAEAVTALRTSDEELPRPREANGGSASATPVTDSGAEGAALETELCQRGFGCQLSVDLRLRGAEQGLELPWSDEASAELASAFEERHQRRFGFALPGEALVLERLIVEVSLPHPVRGSQAADPFAMEVEEPGAAGSPRLDGGDRVPLCLGDAERAGEPDGLRWRRVPLWRRKLLGKGQLIRGPALLLDPTGTLVLEPGWQGQLLADGALLLEHPQRSEEALKVPTATLTAANTSTPPPSGSGTEARPRNDAPAEPVDPVRLELYNHRFSAVAEQMGERLRQSSRSLNIRERLDFSCALFDGEGALVANAPHIPVHLGSMGDSVVALLAAIARGERAPLQRGDAIAANDPYNGGTHLPDITVISPVFVDAADPAAPALAGSNSNEISAAERPLFYVASRGHHADVGGITPGSMPAFSRNIAEEGLLLNNVPLLCAGRFDAATWRQRLRQGPHPVRNPDQLIADLQAQLAANQLGAEELRRLLRVHGLVEVRAYMGHVQANAAEAVREVIGRLRDGSHRVERDDGSCIQVAVRVDRSRRRVLIDFSGSSPQLPSNANAPLAITRAVVLYVFRCLVGRPIPLNAGCFAPIDLVVPPGSLLAPSPPAAVVAGNVETSQAIANALFGALGVQAAAQGTMNNLSFGNARCQYYETLGGGSGAGRDLEGHGFAGASGVQCHMTNSRLTDPEVLEQRCPVRLERFALRHQSGGAGRWAGGDGLERQLCFLEPLTVALLSDNRRVPPGGLEGGAAGCTGANRLEQANGSCTSLPGCCQFTAEPGDRLTLFSPGGGGYGATPGSQESEATASTRSAC
ncbi:MAG: hydantoinase B/oxoprolinase family protein [Synechococcaceae cyanobacterium]